MRRPLAGILLICLCSCAMEEKTVPPPAAADDETLTSSDAAGSGREVTRPQKPDTLIIQRRSVTRAPAPRHLPAADTYVTFRQPAAHPAAPAPRITVAAEDRFVMAEAKYVTAGEPIRIRAGQSVRCLGLERNIINMSQDEGLPGTQVFALLEDRLGRLWIGTDNGLALYDGTWIYIYTMTEGLSGNKITSLAEDKEGKLWVGSASGLCAFDGKGFLQLSAPGGFFGSSAVFGSSGVQVLADGRGRVWTGTPGGLSRYAPRSRNGTLEEGFVNYVPSGNFRQRQVQALYEDASGKIWVGTASGALAFEPVATGEGTGRFLLSPADTTCVTAFAEDAAGRLWMGTCDEGLRIYDDGPSSASGAFVSVGPEDGLAGGSVQCFLRDGNGRMWVGTNGGISIVDGQGVARLGTDQGIAGNVTCLLAAGGDAGHLFIGTEVDGLQQLRMTGFTHFYPEAPAIPSCFMEDDTGRIWAGTHRGGIYIISPDDDAGARPPVLQYPAEALELPPSSTITGLMQDGSGRIWIGTGRHEIILYEGGLFSTFVLPKDTGDAAGGNTNVIFHEDRSGRIWIGSYFGVFVWEPRPGVGTEQLRLLHHSAGSGLSSNMVVALAEDRDGRMWIGTRTNGIHSFADGEGFCHYTAAGGLAGDHIFSISCDEAGRVWTGTEAGLSMLGEGGFTTFTTAGGLPDNLVTSIVTDSIGSVWAGTGRGLACLSEMDGSFSIRTYRKSQGLCRFDFNPNAALAASGGRFWWGTGTVITAYRPHSTSDTATAPAAITGVSVAGRYSRWLAGTAGRGRGNVGRAARAEGVTWSDVAGPYNLPVNLVVPHNLNHLTFHFTAFRLTGPGSLHYRYMMEGLDDTWNEPAGHDEADYRSIPPGAYRFLVHARGENGGWSSAAGFRFEVLPPWWKTGWAYSAYAGGVIAVALSFTRYRTQKLQRDKRQLWEMVSERSARIIKQTEEIIRQREQMRLKRNIHDSLGGLVAALRLNFSVLDPARPPASAKEEAFEAGKKLLDEAYANVKELSMDDLLQERLRSRFFDSVHELLARARAGFGFETRLNAEVDEKLLDDATRENLYMIFREAIHNIVTHSGGKKIIIHAGTADGRLQVTILDDGCGFDAEEASARGNGLRNMRARVKEMNGKFTVLSHPGEGTALKIDLPLKKPV